MQKNKSCEFVVTKLGTIVVPRPLSVSSGIARHKWLKAYFKNDVTIASPAYWKMLCAQNEVKTLTEGPQGFEVV